MQSDVVVVVQSSLPPSTSLSPSVLSFLNSNLALPQDLDRAPQFVAELTHQCSVLDNSLLDLNRRLESSLLSYASHSDQVAGIFTGIHTKLSNLESASRIINNNPDGREGEGLGVAERILGEESPRNARSILRLMRFDQEFDRDWVMVISHQEAALAQREHGCCSWLESDKEERWRGRGEEGRRDHQWRKWRFIYIKM